MNEECPRCGADVSGDVCLHCGLKILYWDDFWPGTEAETTAPVWEEFERCKKCDSFGVFELNGEWVNCDCKTGESK